MKTNKLLFLLLTVSLLTIGTAARAAQPMCMLPYDSAGAYKTEDTPCTSAHTVTLPDKATETVAAYDATKTLINFAGCASSPTPRTSFAFAVVFGNAAPPVALATYDAQIKYNQVQTDFGSPTCVWNIATPSAGDFNPNGYFESILQHVCGTGTPPQIYGAGGSLGNGNWPTPRPKGVELMKWTFGTLNYNPASPPAATPTIVFSKNKASDQDGGGISFTVTPMGADVICNIPPIPPSFVMPPTAVTILGGTPTCAGSPPTGSVTGTRIQFTMPPASAACNNAGVIGTCLPTCTPVGQVKVGGVAVGAKGASPITDTTARPTGTSVTYTVFGTCTGTGATDDATGLAGTPFTPACGAVPVIQSCKNGSTDCGTTSSGSASNGSELPLTVTVNDADSSGSQLTVVLFWTDGTTILGQATATVLSTAAPLTTFKVSLPSSVVNADAASNISFFLKVTDNTSLSAFGPGVCTASPCTGAGNTFTLRTQDISKLAYITWEPGRSPTPNQIPFRAVQQRLIIAFKVTDAAAVTMRIYSPDGILVRQIEDSTFDPFTVNNVCNWQKGCSWDGTSYLGGTNYAANGLYIVNLYATGADPSKPSLGTTINYTKGIVVMK